MTALPIYLDHMSTTPVDPRVADVMLSTLKSLPGNPSAHTHIYGWQANKAVEEAREQVAKLLSADTRSIVWTSGATEANNLAIKGAVAQYARKGKHLVTTAFEHPAVLACFQYLATQGFDVTTLNPDRKGMINPAQGRDAVREDTILVSVMHANNEIGTVQPIANIAEVLKGKGVSFHVDAAQSVGKIPIDVDEMGVDLLTASGHKCDGPKGVGMLYVRQKPRLRLQPQMHGGKQEQGLRTGTLHTQQMVGFGQASVLAMQKMNEESQRLLSWRNQLWDCLSDLPNVHMNGCREYHLPGHLHFTVANKDAEMLMKAMPELALSTASACQQEASEPSYVLSSIGLSAKQALSSLRLAFGRFTTQSEFDQVQSILKRALS